MSIYTIDSMVYDIYSDILHEDFEEKEQTAQVIDDLLKMYEPPSIYDTKSISKWFPWTIFKVKAFCDYISKKEGFLSFRRGQEYYVLNNNKKEKTYFVSTDKKSPFSVGTMSGMVPSYYFNKI